MSLESILTEFYWPAENFPLNLKGKTIDDFKLQSWLFAKELETYKELPKGRQEDLAKSCCDLHGKLLAKKQSRHRMELTA